MYTCMSHMGSITWITTSVLLSGLLCKLLDYSHWLTNTKLQRLKIWENSLHMLSLRCLVFTCVIEPLAKSNTSSLLIEWGRKYVWVTETERERERESHSKIQVANVETDLSSLKIAILLVQSDSLVLLAPTISVINVGQFRGHSCFTIYNMDVCTYVRVSAHVCKCALHICMHTSNNTVVKQLTWHMHPLTKTRIMFSFDMYTFSLYIT